MKKKKKNYVDNKLLYSVLLKYKRECEENISQGLEKPLVPKYVGECILEISSQLSLLHNFINYQFREDMIMDGVLNCFHRDTKILTLEFGSCEISKLVNQEITVKARDGNWRKANVKSYGKQKLFQYGFGTKGKADKHIYQTVTCTENHRWFIQSRLNKRKNRIVNSSVITDLRKGDMIEKTKYIGDIDYKAVIHGLIFGDGSSHKKTVYSETGIVLQGKDYAYIRVCKKDNVFDEIISIFKNAGYNPTYPLSTNGDPMFYLGKFPLCKEVPHTYDESYIRGFIHGWWLADGSKVENIKRKMISTTNENAVEWIKNNAAFGGYHLIKIRITNGGSYPNAKPLYTITLRDCIDYDPIVRYKKYITTDEVFCIEEPVTNGFVLSNGLITGNCLLYLDNFDPDKYNSPFNYFTTICYYAFLSRIEKEKKQLYVKQKTFENEVLFGILQEAELEKTETTVNDLNNDYMNTLVKSFEEKIKEKKLNKKAKKQKNKLYEE